MNQDRYAPQFLYLVASNRDRFAPQLKGRLRDRRLSVEDRYSCERVDPAEWEQNIREKMTNARGVVVFASVATFDEATRACAEEELRGARRQNERAARWEYDFLKSLTDKPIFFITTPHTAEHPKFWEHVYTQTVAGSNVRWFDFDKIDDFLNNDEVVRCVADSVGAVDVYHSGQEHLLDGYFEVASNRAVDALQYEPENPIFNALKLIADANANSFPPKEFQRFFERANFEVPHYSFFQRNARNEHAPRYDRVAVSVNALLGDLSREAWVEKISADFDGADADVVGRLYDYFRALRSVAVSNQIDLWNNFPGELSGVPRASESLTLTMWETLGQKCLWKFRFVPSVDRSYDVWDRDGEPHTIETGDGFWISEVPVTTRQWNAVVQASMDYERHCQYWRHDSPETSVVDVPYNECKKITRLMRNSGFNFFIPTANEWLRACLANSNALIDPVSLDSVAWSASNWRRPGLPRVGSLLPNELGIYDALGNVWDTSRRRRATSLFRRAAEVVKRTIVPLFQRKRFRIRTLGSTTSDSASRSDTAILNARSGLRSVPRLNKLIAALQ